MRTSELLHDAAGRAARYLTGLAERSVTPSAAAIEGLERLHEGLPTGGSAPEEVVAFLDEVVSPATLGIAGPRFFGFVMGGSLPVTLAANLLASAWDQNSAIHQVTPGTAELESVALGWLRELFGLPDDASGGFVTGATMANATALAAARHRVLADAGWDVEADGLFGAPPIQVVVGAEVHPTVRKSLGVLGLGRTRVHEVEVDAHGRMRPDRLPELRSPAILVLQAGNVNTGAFDPFPELVARAHEKGAWVHVDGAFGLWAAASPALRHLTAGMEEADSWSTDFHKWLNVPFDSGIALTRDPEAHAAAMAVSAAYLPSSGVRDPSNFTPELSRRARGVEVWTALKTLGSDGLTQLIERNVRQAQRFAEGLSQAGFEVLDEVVLNQVLVSFGSPEHTRAVVAALQEDGTCYCGPTVWQGRTAMRISVSSWATTDDDVERCLEVMIRLGRKPEPSAAAG